MPKAESGPASLSSGTGGRDAIGPDRFLVCGLGNLGQHCVCELYNFGVKVSAIELQSMDYWQIEGLDTMLEHLCQGDCRRSSLLEDIGISRYRAALIVTSSDRVNIDTAMAIRLISPDVRIVMRSSKEGLNTLLAEQLGNFVAFEPSKLSAPAFALAAMGDTLLACFPMENQVVRVVRRPAAVFPEMAGRRLSSFETRASFPLALETPEREFDGFYQWDSDQILGPDHALITLEVSQTPVLDKDRKGNFPFAGPNHNRPKASGQPPDLPAPEPATAPPPPRGSLARRTKAAAARITSSVRAGLNHFLSDHIRRVALMASVIIFALLNAGAMLFYRFAPGLTPQDAVYDSLVLLLGGYSDLLGSELAFSLDIPWWLRLLGLLLTLSGTVFMGLIYAIITQYLLSSRFRFGRHDTLPRENHVILCGLDRIGTAIADQLRCFGIPFVCIVAKGEKPGDLPVVVQEKNDMEAGLARAGLERAASLVALHKDELINLETGLQARKARAGIPLVIRTYDAGFSRQLARLWPQAQVLSASAFAAQAFAAAALGEKVPSLFRIAGETILVVEYRVTPGDTLISRQLVRCACGYAVVPLLLKKAGAAQPVWLPFDHSLLEAGDTLVVLATVGSILRVETGRLIPPAYALAVEAPLHESARFHGANVLSRMTGTSIGQCRDFMDNLPGIFPEKFYLHQGRRLVDRLRRSMVQARLKTAQP